MSRLIMLVGLAGSGKSTVANFLKQQNENCIVVSSDSIRKELFGDESIQEDPSKVFELVRKRAKELLNNDHDVIIDATNLTSKRRKSFLSEMGDCEKHALVVATKISDCIMQDHRRSRTVGSKVIEEMVKKFEFPLYAEGFDNIQVYYPLSVNFKSNMKMAMSRTTNYGQSNKNHTLDLDEHMRESANHYKGSDESIRMALSVHDIGKPLTRTHFNMKGEPSEDAHYYFHHSVGAYELMFCIDMNDSTLKYDPCKVVTLVNYHMTPYFTKEEKSKKKLLDKLGEELYNEIMELNRCDLLAH